LDSRFSLIAIYCGDSNLWSYLSHKVLYDRIFAGESFFLDLTIDALGREGILLKSADNVFFVAVQLARLLRSSLGCRRNLRG
jgi:hypothetical protein